MSKIISRRTAGRLAAYLRRQGHKIVFTNGCFDIIHSGHVRLLAAARGMGDILFVGLNSDSSVRCLKGPGRPINSEGDRAEVLSALWCVDRVVIFNETTPRRVIAAIKPHVHVKGGDYKMEDIKEAKLVRALGGRVKIIPLLKGKSTTAAAKKLRAVSGIAWL